MAVLGVFLFKDTLHGDILDDKYTNFYNLDQAMILLFRCSTGEDWHKIMFDLYKDKENPFCVFSIYFMTFYIIFVKYIMLNLFILVLIE